MLWKLLSFVFVCSLVSTVMWVSFSMSLLHKPTSTSITNEVRPYKVATTRSLYQQSSSWKDTFMELKVKARLGNQLFAYAALREFSSRKKSTPIILPDHGDIASMFKINPTQNLSISRSSFRAVVEMRRNLSGTLLEIETLEPDNISFVGYYQSPRFFDRIKHEKRKKYRLQDEIANTATQFLRDVVPKGWRDKSYTQVSIHIRRTDHISYKFIEELGFNFPPESYFRLAMEYFTSNHSRVQFIVGSDDIEWCKDFFRPFTENIVFSENHSQEVDLAILSLCDHTITTIGTFSWWVGWLCRGTTIYYEHYNKKPSWVSMVLSPSHYIPRDEYNHWIPLRHRHDRRKFAPKKLTKEEWIRKYGSLE